MNEEEAVVKAKERWPGRIAATVCTEGFAKFFHGLCAVGVRRMLYKNGEWQEADFTTLGVGNTFEQAFENAGRRK